MQSPAAQNNFEFEALLQWYADMGVDIAVCDRPQDRFAQSQSVSEPVKAAPFTEISPSFTAIASGKVQQVAFNPRSSPVVVTPGMSRDELAAAAQSLDQLRASLEAFHECALKTTAARLVFEDGNEKAKVMLVGDAPSADDEREGRPFSGKAGALLDKMLAAIGLDRSQVYLANVVPWRPPGNRAPNLREIAQLRPFFLRQIELVAPDIIVPLGVLAMQTLLQTQEPLMRMRGRKIDYALAGKTLIALPMLHPIFLLNQSSHKRAAWQDLQLLRQIVANAQL